MFLEDFLCVWVEGLGARSRTLWGGGGSRGGLGFASARDVEGLVEAVCILGFRAFRVKPLSPKP